MTVWYSAPTAFRMLMGAGEGQLRKFDLSSLRHILSVGEPLNPEVIRWGMDAFNLRIHDTWWMTETGAHMICNFQCLPIKPVRWGKQFQGLKQQLLIIKEMYYHRTKWEILAIKKGWPAMMRKFGIIKRNMNHIS